MKQSKETLKEHFETGDKPTQEQYSDLIDSYIDSQQEAGEDNRRFVIDETGDVNVTSELEMPEYTLSDIKNNKLSLLKDNDTVTEIDLTSYIDDTNLARLVSGTVDENGIATLTREDNSFFTLDFSSFLNSSSTTGTNTLPSNFQEEGYFSPTLEASGATYTYSSSGTYIRIGNLVKFNIDIYGINTEGIPTADVQIGGLPFDIWNHEDIDYTIIPVYTSGGDVPYSNLRTRTNSPNTFQIYKHIHNDTGGYYRYRDVTFTNGTISLSGCYHTNGYSL